MATSCHQLQHLHLRGCRSITDQGVCAVATSCHLLQHLDLFECSNSTDCGLPAFASHIYIARCR